MPELPEGHLHRLNLAIFHFSRCFLAALVPDFPPDDVGFEVGSFSDSFGPRFEPDSVVACLPALVGLVWSFGRGLLRWRELGLVISSGASVVGPLKYFPAVFLGMVTALVKLANCLSC